MTYRFEKPRRNVLRVFYHCSASDHPEHDNIATMRDWHTAPPPRGRGWSDVGYHFFIRKSGLLELGRPLERIPAAQGGKRNLRKGRKVPAGNRDTIAVCLHGLKIENFTKAQLATLRDLAKQIDEAYDGKVTHHGHTEVAYKACPVLDWRKVLGLDADGRMVSAPDFDGAVVPTEDPEATINTEFGLGSNGWFVRQIQKELKAKGYHPGGVDGFFGKLTAAAVFQLKLDNKMDMSNPDMPISLLQVRQAGSRDPVRADIKMKDLRRQGSTQVKNADAGQVATLGAGTASVAYSALPDGQSTAEQVEEVLGKAEQAKDLATRAQEIGNGVIEQASSNLTNILLIALAAAVAYLILQRVKERRLEEAKELKNL